MLSLALVLPAVGLTVEFVSLVILFLLENISPVNLVHSCDGHLLIESHYIVPESRHVAADYLLLLLLAFHLSVFPAQLCHSAPFQHAVHSLCTL